MAKDRSTGYTVSKDGELYISIDDLMDTFRDINQGISDTTLIIVINYLASIKGDCLQHHLKKIKNASEPNTPKCIACGSHNTVITGGCPDGSGDLYSCKDCGHDGWCD